MAPRKIRQATAGHDDVSLDEAVACTPAVRERRAARPDRTGGATWAGSQVIAAQQATGRRWTFTLASCSMVPVAISARMATTGMAFVGYCRGAVRRDDRRSRTEFENKEELPFGRLLIRRDRLGPVPWLEVWITAQDRQRDQHYQGTDLDLHVSSAGQPSTADDPSTRCGITTLGSSWTAWHRLRLSSRGRY